MTQVLVGAGGNSGGGGGLKTPFNMNNLFGEKDGISTLNGVFAMQKDETVLEGIKTSEDFDTEIVVNGIPLQGTFKNTADEREIYTTAKSLYINNNPYIRPNASPNRDYNSVIEKSFGSAYPLQTGITIKGFHFLAGFYKE